MEVMSGLAVLALGMLAVFMYFKTRPPPPSPALHLDLSIFNPVTDPQVCVRIIELGRAASGTAATPDPPPIKEDCFTDGDRFVYRARAAPGRSSGTATVLLDRDFNVRGTKQTISS